MQKYLSLPIQLIYFWYPAGLNFFLKLWKNLILYLEEDLAVGLMIKLIFVPLFHDSSIVGRILSFLFRSFRILVGLFAFTLATLLVLALAVYWFALPALAILDKPLFLSQAILLAGLGIFILEIILNPHKKVWQIKNGNPWLSSLIKREDLSAKKLLQSREVVSLLENLEIAASQIPNFEISDIDSLGQNAYEMAKKNGAPYITAAHFFVTTLKELPNIDQYLLKFELTMEDFEKTLTFLDLKRDSWRKVWIWEEDFTIHHLKGVNRGWLGVPTPSLDLISQDLTKEAASKGFADFIRNNNVVSEIINILSQKTGRNVVIVGPAGSGKSALVKHLAKQIVKGDAPAAMATKRLVLLDLVKLLSGINSQGELADRVKNIFDEVSFAENVIIVIEEIHELGLGEAGAQYNLYSLMEPYLESDAFQFMATTEVENYSRILEKNSSFARLFIKVELPPATEDDSLKILQDRAIITERKEKIKITYLALKTAVNLAARFIHDRVLPDSAISVVKEAQTQAMAGWVKKDTIRRVIEQRSKIPMVEVGNVDKGRLLNLESEIHNIFIGQEQAVKLVSDTLRRSVTGLREGNRPIGSFLFVGPTGVGKTELAKTLAKVYFKNEGAFIRFDMSEYQSAESVSRLIGGSETEGQLTEAVRNRPYALLLLDEFEKADPKILTLFLQVLEDGRLTDSAGRTVDFTNTIIIATSNAASLTIAKGLESGQTLEQLDKPVNDELLQIFKPELINRFDDVVLFRPLNQQELQLVEFDDQLVSELARRGYDPVLGARPLRRLIQDTLEANLSRMILENKLNKGQTFNAGVDLL
ncbi:ATP-dependent Clp protease ATP-binding subunit [Candidatus Daviesbacteria bacterium]|nr:ATP-dependent Clp protease ATP-binding subunit [Candidatus Daviesbacteria bacterium]